MAAENTTLDEFGKPKTECPTCGRDGFASKPSMHSHHKQVHGESLSVRELDCDHCGASFERRIGLIEEDQDHYFCGQDCFHSHFEENEHFNEDGGRVTVECDYCGTEMERWRNDQEHHDRLYCSVECADEDKSGYQSGPDHNQYNRVELECAYCGDLMHRKPSTLLDVENAFCSRPCISKWRSENVYGENHPCWKEPASLECSNCGAELERNPHHAEYYDDVFCDLECRGEWLRGELVGENSPRWNRVEEPCATCGETQSVTPSKVENNDNIFCSRECYGDWISNNRRGENHPRWKESADSYGPEWTEALKREVRERDGQQCRDCGISVEEHLERYGRKLSVHHIVPVRTFANIDNAHEKANLIALCCKCHQKWEQMPYLKPQ